MLKWIHRVSVSVTLLVQSCRCFSIGKGPLSFSPIQECSLYGRKVHIKRDDLLHLDVCREVSGNKVRKFKDLLLNKHASHIVSYGGSQSNAMRALALLSKAGGKQFVYFARPLSKALLNHPSGNLRDSLEHGMEVSLLI
jgi:1-aminocyclopropane-1-carboxylate deaminase